jgi:hypothetical protein
MEIVSEIDKVFLDAEYYKWMGRKEFFECYLLQFSSLSANRF